MQNKVEELKKISKDLDNFIQQNCPITADGKRDFIGESCDNAYEMLAETVRKLDDKIEEEKSTG